jgi:hypothetical protein
MLGLSFESNAQLREDLDHRSTYTGPIIKTDKSAGANLGNLFNMEMDHSYSMMFGSFGGQFQNMNAYTNTMRFFFSEKLTGRLDLSLLHSPFGNNVSMVGNNMGSSTGMNTQFLIRNAELNYQINDKSNISIHFQQLPSYGRYSGFYRPHYGSPFQNY